MKARWKGQFIYYIKKQWGVGWWWTPTKQRRWYLV